MPLFSVILAYHQASTPFQECYRGMLSILNQSCQDYELLAYHDGPMDLRPDEQFPLPMRCTEKRLGGYGQPLFDYVLPKATGEYVVFFSGDNFLYRHALERIAAEIARAPVIYDGDRPVDTNDIILFPIYLCGMQRFRDKLIRMKDRRDLKVLLPGYPPAVGYIDTLQLVMKRELWNAEGGWHEYRYVADGIRYPQLLAKYGHRIMSDPLGEHY